jgi:hypothetical protein
MKIFHIPVVAGHTYKKWVREIHGVGMEYGVRDENTGKIDRWVDHLGGKEASPMKRLSTFTE